MAENQEPPHPERNYTKHRRHAAIFFRIIIYIFAAVGFVLVGGYTAVRLHLTDVSGSTDLNDRYFTALHSQNNDLAAVKTASGTASFGELSLWCKLFALKNDSPTDAARVLGAYQKTNSPALALSMIESINERIATGTLLQNDFAACDAEWLNVAIAPTASGTVATASVYPWMNTPEWSTLSQAIRKDAPVINNVSAETGVSPRMIAAQLVGEQMRLYNTERELYKSAFAPLNILGSETQFSLGVAGIKTETAIAIENNLDNPSSDYYPGDAYAHLLDFKTSDHNTERYDRITDEHDHYYSYLYAALFIKEAESQWARAGYDISQRPEIVSTLYNIGFAGSHPNADPHVGGATIVIASTTYTFGSLGYDFYYSGELEDVLPYNSSS
jgi:hypothetical protein